MTSPPATCRQRALLLGLLTGAVLTPPYSARGADWAPAVATRVGWAYGLGAEVEVRPGHWGASASGGHVPGYGPGGYLTGTWGLRPLGHTGPVAEAGVFYGQNNPLRVAASGFGACALIGAEWAPASPFTVRLVAGEGLPFSRQADFPSWEFLARLTAGLAW